jgi:hypothetical protein
MGSVLDQPRNEAERLGIVDDDDVAGSHEAEDRLEVLCGDGVVVRALVRTERAEVPEVSVQPIVDPLRDLEEAWISFEDQPPNGQCFGKISEVGAEELRDAAALGGRVDMHERAATQELTSTGESPVESLDLPVVHGSKQAGGGTADERCLEH